MELDADQKSTINDLLKRLSVTRKELCNHIIAREESGKHYAPSNLSDFLNSSKKKGMNSRTWVQLVEGLKTLAMEKPDLCARDPRIKLAIEDVASWSHDANESLAAYLHPPGGPVPSRAANYIPNTTQDISREVLDYTNARSVLVRGGVWLGRSSWIQRLCNDAEEKGARLVFNDENSLKIPSQENPIQRLLMNIAEGLGSPEISNIDVSDGDYVRAAEDLIEMLINLHDDGETYIVVEDVQTWPNTVNKHGDLVDFVTQVQTELIKCEDKFSYKLVVASALTPSMWSAFVGSPLENHSTVADLTYLSLVDVSILTKIYDLSKDLSEEVFKLTAGHPKFTQRVLWSLKQGAEFENVRMRAVGLDPSDGWDGVAERLSFLLSAHAEKMGVNIFAILGKFDQQGTDIKLNKSEFRLLKSMGLIDGGQRNLTVSQIARSMFSHWLFEEECQ